jgi:AcrR family transcriptional regulator
MTTTTSQGTGRRSGASRGLLGPSLTPREEELLTATLEVLRETGYDNLTVDKVVARAHASKTTVYRRWPSKGELVCAAFAHAVHIGAAPDTGTLRGDLLALAEIIAQVAGLYARTIAGILATDNPNPHLRELFLHDLYRARRDQVYSVLHRAVSRGEIAADVINEDIWDLLPGYISHRMLQHGRPVTSETLRALVDEVMLPSLTRQLPSEPPSMRPGT